MGFEEVGQFEQQNGCVRLERINQLFDVGADYGPFIPLVLQVSLVCIGVLPLVILRQSQLLPSDSLEVEVQLEL